MNQSTLKEPQLKSAIKNCKSIRELETKTPVNSILLTTDTHDPDEEERGYVPYVLFAFGSDYNLTTLRKKLEDMSDNLSVASDERIDVLLVLDRGVIFRSSPTDNIEVDSESSDYEIEEDLPPFFYSYFYYMLKCTS